eukprot:1143581-Pelagomonas_calceolata.AAC.3
MGFFYCTGHGMSDAQISEAIGAARSLFELDMQQKQVSAECKTQRSSRPTTMSLAIEVACHLDHDMLPSMAYL